MCDRSEQPAVTSWGRTHESQSSFFHEKTQHDGTGQSVVDEEKLHDRTGQPVVVPQREMRLTMQRNWKCRQDPDHSWIG